MQEAAAVTHVTLLPGLMFNTRHSSLLGECQVLWWGGVLLPGKRGRLLSLREQPVLGAWPLLKSKGFWVCTQSKPTSWACQFVLFQHQEWSPGPHTSWTSVSLLSNPHISYQSVHSLLLLIAELQASTRYVVQDHPSSFMGIYGENLPAKVLSLPGHGGAHL